MCHISQIPKVIYSVHVQLVETLSFMDLFSIQSLSSKLSSSLTIPRIWKQETAQALWFSRINLLCWSILWSISAFEICGIFKLFCKNEKTDLGHACQIYKTYHHYRSGLPLDCHHWNIVSFPIAWVDLCILFLSLLRNGEKTYDYWFVHSFLIWQAMASTS